MLIAVIFTLTALLSVFSTQPSYAADSGKISGTVTDMNGEKPIEDAIVGLFDWQGNSLKNEVTGADGKYSFTGLANGKYHLIFESEAHSYSNWDISTAISIKTSDQSKVVNVQLGKDDYKISGSIKWLPEHLSGDDLTFYVNAYRLNTATNKYENVGLYADISEYKHGKEHKYELSLPAGTYKIAFEYQDSNNEKHVSYQWYNKQESEAAATVVKVDKNISGINAVSPYKWQKQTGGTWKCLAYDKALTGWKKVNGKWHHFTPAGIMQTGWKKVGDSWYYFGTANDGAMKTGWKKINNKWYYFGTANDGKMKTGWVKDNNKWYYLKSGGTMVTGTQKINGKKCVFNASGVWIK